MLSEKQNKTKRPGSGFIFWPVGNGDSTTIVVDDDTTFQVDINNLETADDKEDPRLPVIDELVTILPEVEGKPFLSSFVLTHPDEDHCRGFEKLLDRVTIGELWFTPRVFREYNDDLCKDAKKFRKEAKRRVKAMIENEGDVESGDRVRIIGYDDLLQEDDYEGFPKKYLTTPGSEITEINREALPKGFRAFIHAPFKDDASGDRNDTSVSMQVTLLNDDTDGKAMMFGDLSYPIIKKIFDRSEDDNLEWDIMLAAHHCSKSVMYWQDEDEDESKLKRNILDSMEEAANEHAYIISSSEPIPGRNEAGDDPPHAKAKNRYQEIIEADHFICTQEHPSIEDPLPIIFEITEEGLSLSDAEDDGEEDGDDGPGKTALGAAIVTARGENKPPSRSSRYGCSK